jgi:hypothetical protein
MGPLHDDLSQASRHLGEAQDLLAQQRDLVQALIGRGQDATQALAVLSTMRLALIGLGDHHERVSSAHSAQAAGPALLTAEDGSRGPSV